jgi:hypothetical protein
MIVTTFLLLSVPLAVELREDYVQIVKKKKVDDHANDMIARSILIVVCAVLDSLANHGAITWLQLFQSILMGIAWFWLWFDYLLNLFAFPDRAFFSLGTTSWTDRKLSFLPWYGVLFAKIWFFGVAIGVYYYWDLIVS